MRLEALVFDVDGTLADTEEAHRRAFNAAFRVHGLDWDWTPEVYGVLLNVAGGKERLTHWVGSLAVAPEERDRLRGQVPEIHATKTREFAGLVAQGELRPRTGIARLIGEARGRGVPLGIASTTTLANVEALVPALLGEEALSWFDVVAVGDVVPRKKPAPDIYQLAVRRLGAAPEHCAAFEDSDLGVRAARAAGLFTVAVCTRWTREHDLSSAHLQLPSLGDPDAPLDSESADRIGGPWLDVDRLAARHGSWASTLPATRAVS